MKIDLFLIGNAFHRAAREVPAMLAEYAVVGERSGFAAAWFAEHHFIRYGACPSVPLLAAHVLARTTTLQVGSAACVLSNRHPVALAEETAMLDGLAAGRFLLGVARGGKWVDLEVFGTGEPRFTDGFCESLDLLRDWLSGVGEVSADGRFFRFRPVPVLARPIREPPIWVAATSTSTVDVAARRGLPLLLGVHTDDTEKAALIRRWCDTAAQYGHDPSRGDHAAVYLALDAESRRAGAERLRESMTGWYSAGVGDYVGLDGSRGNPDQRSYVERLIANHLVGPVSESADRLSESAARTGISRALLLVEGQSDSAAVADNIAALGAGLNRSAQPPTDHSTASSTVGCENS